MRDLRAQNFYSTKLENKQINLKLSKFLKQIEKSIRKSSQATRKKIHLLVSGNLVSAHLLVCLLLTFSLVLQHFVATSQLIPLKHIKCSVEGQFCQALKTLVNPIILKFSFDFLLCFIILISKKKQFFNLHILLCIETRKSIGVTYRREERFKFPVLDIICALVMLRTLFANS